MSEQRRLSPDTLFNLICFSVLLVDFLIGLWSPLLGLFLIVAEISFCAGAVAAQRKKDGQP